MNIRLYATLRPLVGGARSVTVPADDGESAGAVLSRLIEQYPALTGEILASAGSRLLPHVQVFVAGRSIRDLQGLATFLKGTDELVIFPPVAGG